MLTSTNRSRKFPENINSQIASNLDNWQIVFLTNQSLHSNSFEALYGPFFNLTPPSWWHLLSASAFEHGPSHVSPGMVIAQCNIPIVFQFYTNLQLCQLLEGLLKVSDPPPLLHLKLCLRSLGETLEHRAHLLLPDEKHGKYCDPIPFILFAFLIHSPTSIRLEVLTYSQPGQHLCYELWPCQDPCSPSRSWLSISVVCKVIIF